MATPLVSWEVVKVFGVATVLGLLTALPSRAVLHWLQRRRPQDGLWVIGALTLPFIPVFTLLALTTTLSNNISGGVRRMALALWFAPYLLMFILVVRERAGVSRDFTRPASPPTNGLQFSECVAEIAALGAAFVLVRRLIPANYFVPLPIALVGTLGILLVIVVSVLAGRVVWLVVVSRFAPRSEIAKVIRANEDSVTITKFFCGCSIGWPHARDTHCVAPRHRTGL